MMQRYVNFHQKQIFDEIFNKKGNFTSVMAENKQDISSRLKQLRIFLGLNSGAFAQKAGIDPRNYSSIETKKRTVGERVLRDVCNAFNADMTWLLTGEGEMIKEAVRDGVIAVDYNQINEHRKGTPVYDIDATCGQELRSFEDEQIIGYVDLPGVRQEAHIVTACGDSMMPKIYDGDKIALREVNSWDYMYYGQIYLILTPDYRMLKYVRKHPTKDDVIILHSENDQYDDIELPKSEIKRLFVVENILSIKNMM